jgi:hypothetical protein
MLEFLRDILTSDPGSFGFVFALIVLAIWLVYWVTKKITEIKSDHGTLNKCVEKMDGSIDEIRRDLSYMKGSMDIFKSGGTSSIQAHSPMSLTDIGVQVAKSLDAENVITQNWERILKDLEENICDKNAYDIQMYCIETAAVEPERFFDKEALTAIKNLAYKEGRPFQQYSNVYGVLIRDRYLRYKNIDLALIDKNAPTPKKS